MSDLRDRRTRPSHARATMAKSSSQDASKAADVHERPAASLMMLAAPRLQQCPCGELLLPTHAHAMTYDSTPVMSSTEHATAPLTVLSRSLSAHSMSAAYVMISGVFAAALEDDTARTAAAAEDALEDDRAAAGAEAMLHSSIESVSCATMVTHMIRSTSIVFLFISSLRRPSFARTDCNRVHRPPFFSATRNTIDRPPYRPPPPYSPSLHPPTILAAPDGACCRGDRLRCEELNTASRPPPARSPFIAST